MTMTFVLIAIIILVALIYLASLSGDYEIRVSRELNAAPEDVFDKIVDLKTWSEWSPWLMHEPDCPLEFEGNTNEVGGSYSWDGKIVGAGTMEHSILEKPIRTEQKLTFTRPFKSVCSVGFDLESIGDSSSETSPTKTKVTWWMKGSMPFLFRPMIPRTKEMISRDYDTGLAMLGGILDPNSEYPSFDFLGEQKRAATTYLAVPWEGSVEDMPEAMEKGFRELTEHVQSGDTEATGMPFSVYHKMKKRGTYFVIDMAMPVAEGTQDDKYQVKQIPEGKYHQTQLTGSYDFLKAAWYSAMNHLRMAKIKFDWKRPCVELYENDHREVEHTNEIVTSIYIPVK